MNETSHTAILHFFLNIYRTQMNAPGSPGEFVPVAFADEEADTIYEFRLKRDNRWFTRRMSIGPLSEDSGSKSKCYKVIYDDLLVVKIPPKPVSDFDNYIKSLRMEREIARLLGPEIECITPTVSAILKKIPFFSRYAFSGQENFEERCIEKLKASREYQNYLKIGNNFVFFSNLAKYAFLGQIVKDIHFRKPDIYNEILSHISMLDHPVLFEDIYGKSGTSVFYRITELYAAYEEKFALLPEREKYLQITSYQKKRWFLTALAEREPDMEFSDAQLLSGLNAIIGQTLISERETVRSYRNMVKEHIRAKNFQHNKAAMRGIIVNLLDLLATLREKGVAIRDLKPDNVFISGNISENPVLLSTPHEYSIGLIDFETAAVYRTEEEKKISQPMLAGTPSYATPSHLFRNELLDLMYDNLSRILHLQDWQAVNSMIYNVIAGRRLSMQTGRLISGMAGIIRQALKQNMTRAGAFQECNRIFWCRAAGEFQERTESHREFLDSSLIPLPEPVQRMFTAEARETLSGISRRIQTIVSSQQIFRTPQTRERLCNANQETLNRWKNDWERNENVPQTRPDTRKEIARLLGILADLRQESARILDIVAFAKQQSPALSAYEVMFLMFRVVVNAMYKPEWGILDDSSRIREMQTGQMPDISDEESVNIEKTLL